MQSMPISLYSYALTNYARLRRDRSGGRSSGTTHLGFQHLDNADHHAVADRVLRISWHGRKAASALLPMQP